MQSRLRLLCCGWGLMGLLLGDYASAGQNVTPIPRGDVGSAMFKAVVDGDAARVTVLLKQGADVNARNEYFQTPLIIAAEQGYVAIVRLLLDHGAEMEARCRDGNTALLQATDEGQVPVVRLLLEHGADLRVKNNFRSDALWLTGRKEQPADEADAAAIRKLLLAYARQAKRHAAADARTRRQLVPLYEHYTEAYRDGDWTRIGALFASGYSFNDGNNKPSSRREWLQSLQQRRRENPDYPFWFIVDTAIAHGRAATVRVFVPAHRIWKDTWIKTAHGWQLQQTQVWGDTVGPPPSSPPPRR